MATSAAPHTYFNFQEIKGWAWSSTAQSTLDQNSRDPVIVQVLPMTAGSSGTCYVNHLGPSFPIRKMLGERAQQAGRVG